jgi:hypothetical protein
VKIAGGMKPRVDIAVHKCIALRWKYEKKISVKMLPNKNKIKNISHSNLMRNRLDLIGLSRYDNEECDIISLIGVL